MYDTPAALLAAIGGGEDSLLECKEVIVSGAKFEVAGEGQAVPWLARQLCAFANADGGVLALGVRDDGVVVGIPAAAVDGLQQLLVNAARDGVEPPLDHLMGVDAMLVPAGSVQAIVLKVDIRADYYAVHAPRGKRPYVRVANTTKEVSMEGLARLLARRSVLASADERPVLRSPVSDLDFDRLGRYHETRFGRASVDLVTEDDLGKAHPSVAGILLFGAGASDPNAVIQVVSYGGVEPDTDARLDSRTFEGPVQQQVVDLVDYLAHSPSVATTTTKSADGRTDALRYSLRALQEAAVNAVAHRDYAIPGPVQVRIFGDRIELASPGRLPNSLTPEDLFAGAPPIRRNQVLVGFLMHAATWPPGRWAMDGHAEGFLTIVRETEALAGTRPVVRQGTESFTLIIPAARMDNR